MGKMNEIDLILDEIQEHTDALSSLIHELTSILSSKPTVEKTQIEEKKKLTLEEVRRMGIEKIYIDLDVKVGDTVRVINGPFENFMGEVEEVNMEKQTLRARVSMFGRDTPVELDFAQVDKV